MQPLTFQLVPQSRRAPHLRLRHRYFGPRVNPPRADVAAPAFVACRLARLGAAMLHPPHHAVARPTAAAH